MKNRIENGVELKTWVIPVAVIVLLLGGEAVVANVGEMAIGAKVLQELLKAINTMICNE